MSWLEGLPVGLLLSKILCLLDPHALLALKRTCHFLNSLISHPTNNDLLATAIFMHLLALNYKQSLLAASTYRNGASFWAVQLAAGPHHSLVPVVLFHCLELPDFAKKFSYLLHLAAQDFDISMDGKSQITYSPPAENNQLHFVLQDFGFASILAVIYDRDFELIVVFQAPRNKNPL